MRSDIENVSFHIFRIIQKSQYEKFNTILQYLWYGQLLFNPQRNIINNNYHFIPMYPQRRQIRIAKEQNYNKGASKCQDIMKKSGPYLEPNHHQYEHENTQKHSTLAIVTDLQNMQLEKGSFKQCWKEMVGIVGPEIKFANYMPSAVGERGNELMNDPRFIAHWLKIMRMCSYVCFPILLRATRKKYGFPFQEFNQQCKEGQQQQITNRQMTIKALENPPRLKRNLDYFVDQPKIQRLWEQRTQFQSEAEEL